MATVNYVKFQRGTIANYVKLQNHGLIDNNTLYFVYETSASTTGSLYLGTRLISGVGGGTSVTKLSDLSDVLATTASTGSFLICNDDGKWEATSLTEVAELIAGQLQINVNENTFEFTAVSGSKPQLNLIGYSDAENGSYAMKGVDGKLKWFKPTEDFNVLSEKVGTLQETIDGLDTVIANKIAETNHLTYKKVGSLDQATDANTIYLVPKSGTENDAYSEYMVIDGVLEHLGTFNNGTMEGYATTAELQAVESKLDNYVLTSVFQATVGDLTTLSNYSEGTTVVDEINNIYEQLRWHELADTAKNLND